MDDAARDMPEMISYILHVENVPQLSFICHSSGCTLILMAVHENPGLNKLVKKASFLAPGPYFSHVSSPTILALVYLPEFLLLVIKLNIKS